MVGISGVTGFGHFEQHSVFFSSCGGEKMAGLISIVVGGFTETFVSLDRRYCSKPCLNVLLVHLHLRHLGDEKKRAFSYNREMGVSYGKW